LKYRLALSENEKAEFGLRNVGSFVHYVLERLFNEAIANEKTIADFTPEERKKIAFLAADDYLESITDGAETGEREKHVIERIKNTALPVIDDICTEFSNCKFETKLTERKIGDSGKGKPEDKSAPERLEFTLDNGEKVQIGGIVDRIDVYKSQNKVYLRVIDYKTGSKIFSKNDLKEGRNLQMFLYLKALIDSKNPEFLKSIGATAEDELVPAGVIYVKTEFGDTQIAHQDEALAEEEFKKKQKRGGMILDEPISIEAMNKDYLPVKYRKDGSLAKGYEEYLYTRDEFDGHIETIRKSVNTAVSGMKSGNLSALPMKNKKSSPCEYCKFKPICRNVKQN
jgi:ATP-dependent helicase/nuclease subunit B